MSSGICSSAGGRLFVGNIRIHPVNSTGSTERRELLADQAGQSVQASGIFMLEGGLGCILQTVMDVMACYWLAIHDIASGSSDILDGQMWSA